VQAKRPAFATWKHFAGQMVLFAQNATALKHGI
jgi:hypothetical protein